MSNQAKLTNQDIREINLRILEEIILSGFEVEVEDEIKQSA